MKKIIKKFLIKLADSIIIILFSWIILFGASWVYASIAEFSYTTAPSLTKNQYDGLVKKINDIVNEVNRRSGALGTASILQISSDENNCYWSTLTNEHQECLSGYILNGMCLSNTENGCPQGNANLGGIQSEWHSTGAMKCCKIAIQQ